jgi:hypothetical protein
MSKPPRRSPRQTRKQRPSLPSASPAAPSSPKGSIRAKTYSSTRRCRSGSSRVCRGSSISRRSAAMGAHDRVGRPSRLGLHPGRQGADPQPQRSRLHRTLSDDRRELLKLNVRSAVIVGEAVVLDEIGRSNFADLQAALTRHGLRRDRLSPDVGRGPRRVVRGLTMT